jgi:hypothetical protein
MSQHRPTLVITNLLVLWILWRGSGPLRELGTHLGVLILRFLIFRRCSSFHRPLTRIYSLSCLQLTCRLPTPMQSWCREWTSIMMVMLGQRQLYHISRMIWIWHSAQLHVHATSIMIIKIANTLLAFIAPLQWMKWIHFDTICSRETRL